MATTTLPQNHRNLASNVLQISDYKHRLRNSKSTKPGGDCGPLNEIYFTAQDISNPVLREKIVSIVMDELSKVFGG